MPFNHRLPASVAGAGDGSGRHGNSWWMETKGSIKATTCRRALVCLLYSPSQGCKTWNGQQLCDNFNDISSSFTTKKQLSSSWIGDTSLHFKVSLLNMFVLEWKQRHRLCWGMKSSEVHQVQVKIWYKTALCTWQFTLKHCWCFSSHANNRATKHFISFVGKLSAKLIKEICLSSVVLDPWPCLDHIWTLEYHVWILFLGAQPDFPTNKHVGTYGCTQVWSITGLLWKTLSCYYCEQLSLPVTFHEGTIATT